MIAVLGAGLLGAGFVENLRKKGEAVRVWNRTAEKLAPLVALGAEAAATPADAVRGASRVHLVLAEDSAVDSVIAAAREGLGEGVVIYDHSTNLPEKVAARCETLRAAGVRYLHAPVFMSPANARDATGIMLVAGPASEVAEATPVLSTMTGKLWNVGERVDLAAAYKLLGNSVLLSMSGVMGDFLAMADAMRLTPEAALSLFEHFPIGNSLPFFAQRAARRGAGSASFSLEMAHKDVRLMIEAAGGPEGLIVLPAVDAGMTNAEEAGHRGKDFAVYAWPRARRTP